MKLNNSIMKKQFLDHVYFHLITRKALELRT
jgi:hypothetical protein